MNSEDAQILALHALTFLLDEPQRLEGFLRMTGIEPHDLRAIAGSNDGQTAILDYLLGNEPLLLAFTAEEGCDDQDPTRARQTLGGRAMTQDWTSA
ncbi:MAG: DUF3572 domain-containing protein [Candidatus Phaeomarinobacter sp.]